jgi:TRAP-type C4-dicarboxylate transport system permease large subunit
LSGICAAGSGIATVAACGGFAAICGSSVATAATVLGRRPIRRCAASATRNPSHRRDRGRRHAGAPCCRRRPVLAVYGIITEQDIGKLFIAGIIPACSR